MATRIEFVHERGAAPEELQRAVAALIPFVHTWNLPLNPEDLDLIAHAVLLHREDDTTLADIPDAVERLIEEAAAAHQRMMSAMQRSTRDPNDPQ
jgi:hypothetical protein